MALQELQQTDNLVFTEDELRLFVALLLDGVHCNESTSCVAPRMISQRRAEMIAARIDPQDQGTRRRLLGVLTAPPPIV